MSVCNREEGVGWGRLAHWSHSEIPFPHGADKNRQTNETREKLRVSGAWISEKGRKGLRESMKGGGGEGGIKLTLTL